MSEDNQPVIHEPSDGETLVHYLARYSNEDIQKIFELSEKLYEFSSVLLYTPWPSETEGLQRSLPKVWEIHRCTDNFKVLLPQIKLWEPTRKELLELLSNSANELTGIAKWCSTGRFIGCALECGSTVAGLLLEDIGSDYGKWFLRTATCFGALGLGSTLLEMKMSHEKLRRIRELVERDQKLFAPIQNWYQQIEELEKAMKVVFPFDFTEKYVKDFIGVADGANDLDPVERLSRLLIAIAKTGQNALRDRTLLQNIMRFIRCPDSHELCKWIFFRRNQHPVVFDITRMLLQLYYSPLKFLCCQSVKALAPENQSLFAKPVYLRIALNGYSIVDAITRLWGNEVPVTFEMKQLEIQLKTELYALKEVILKDQGEIS